jgi:hypothetical protein
LRFRILVSNLVPFLTSSSLVHLPLLLQLLLEVGRLLFLPFLLLWRPERLLTKQEGVWWCVVFLPGLGVLIGSLSVAILYWVVLMIQMHPLLILLIAFFSVVSDSALLSLHAVWAFEQVSTLPQLIFLKSFATLNSVSEYIEHILLVTRQLLIRLLLVCLQPIAPVHLVLWLDCLRNLRTLGQ